ncbi:MAG: TetR/AcrR family transcriptional regulator [Acidobacteriota bacterium]|nr:TetR/AcrR family transcriptional regulator [Acidobacteriota bacterium]
MVTKKKSRPASPGLRQRRRLQTEEKIFLSAMHLFRDKGFVQTTVEEITRAAGVAKGTFFNYFPSKEHVLGFLIERQKGAVAAHLEMARAGQLPVPEVLKRLGHALTLFPGKSPQMARSVIAAFLANEDVRARISVEMSTGRQAVAEMIRLGQQRGQIRSDAVPAQLAHNFHRALIGTVVLWALDPVSPLKKHLEETIALVVAGACPAAQAPCPPARRKKEAQ